MYSNYSIVRLIPILLLLTALIACDTIDSVTIEDTDETTDTELTVTTISTEDIYLHATLSLDSDSLFVEVLVRNTDGDDINLTNGDSITINLGAEDITLEKKVVGIFLCYFTELYCERIYYRATIPAEELFNHHAQIKFLRQYSKDAVNNFVSIPDNKMLSPSTNDIYSRSTDDIYVEWSDPLISNTNVELTAFGDYYTGTTEFSEYIYYGAMNLTDNGHHIIPAGSIKINNQNGSLEHEALQQNILLNIRVKRTRIGTTDNTLLKNSHIRATTTSSVSVYSKP